MTRPPDAQTPTPRTDALVTRDAKRDTLVAHNNMLDHARQLERELQAERERGRRVREEFRDLGDAMLAAPDNSLRWYAERLAQKLGCTGPYCEADSSDKKEKR